jgi:hypothetical protein
MLRGAWFGGATMLITRPAPMPTCNVQGTRALIRGKLGVKPIQKYHAKRTQGGPLRELLAFGAAGIQAAEVGPPELLGRHSILL